CCSCGLRIGSEELSIHDHLAAVLVGVRRILRLVGDVAHFATRYQQTPDRLGIGHCIYLSLVHRQAEFTGRKHAPTDFLARSNAPAGKYPVGEDEGRGAHPRNTNSLAAQILDRMNIAVRRCLDAKASSMNSAGELNVESLFNRLEKIHDQVLC